MSNKIEDWNTFFKEWVETKENTLFIENTIFDSDVVLSNNLTDIIIQFKECHFNNKVKFLNFDSVNSITIKECKFKKGLFFENNLNLTYIPKIEIHKTEGDIFIHSGFYKYFIITGTKETTLAMTGGTFERLSINNPLVREFKKVHIDVTKIKGSIYIRDLNCESLTFRGTSNECNILVENGIIENLNIDRYRSKTGIVFNNLLDKTQNFNKIYVNSSDLGCTEFRNLNMKNTDFTILDSQVIDCLIINKDWDYKINKIETNPKKYGKFTGRLVRHDVLMHNRQKTRDIYRQLKHSLEKIGDNIGALKLHSREMSMYYKCLKWFNKNDFTTKLVLGLSKLTSNYGQSISRPFTSLLLVNSIFFFFVLLTKPNFIDNVYLNFEKCNWQGFENAIIWVLKISNPFERIDYGFGGHLFLIVFMKIWSSYMIYNFIRASRRFIK